MQTDPNSWYGDGWKDLPILPKEEKDDVVVKKERTLEDRVKELEYKVEDLERMISNLQILESKFRESILLNAKEEIAKKKKNDRGRKR